MIDLSVEVEKIVKIAQLRKTEICVEDNGISDMQAFVVFQIGDIFECRQSGIDGHPFESLPSVLNGALNDGLSKFDTVSLIVDSFVRLAPLEKMYQNGDLEKEYKNNPDAPVSEALTVATYGYDGQSIGKCHTYIYNDNGLPEFTEFTGDAQVKSDFVDFVMSSYIEFCKKHA